MEKRGKTSIIILSIISALFLFVVVLSSAGPISEEAMNITPCSITVDDKEVPDAWRLFDMDEDTIYQLTGKPRQG